MSWSELLQAIRKEFSSLADADRQWLRQRVARIAVLQTELDALFRAADGPQACANCDGACCACGRHHLTLTNLLGYLLEHSDPPTPDFSLTCPFLGTGGCLLPVARRPYNCITFFCETLDDRLTVAEAGQLRSLDLALRSEYELVAQRYPLASLRGLWLALARYDGGFLLRPQPESC